MAILIQSQPSEYALAYNNNAWVFQTTNYTPTVRFRIAMFPIDFPTLPLLGQVRVYPTRSDDSATVYLDRAFFDPSRWLQSQVSQDVDIPPVDHASFFPRNKMHYEYRLVVQEEDVDANNVYQNGDLIITEVKSIWNGVKDAVDWLDFDYTDYTINTVSTTKKFLTTSPRTLDINTGQSVFLYFIVNTANAVTNYELKTYDGYNAGGSVINTASVSNLVPDTGTEFSSTYLSIAVGTEDIVNMNSLVMSGSTPATVLNGAKSYTVQLRNSSGDYTSELFTFNIDQVCTKYTPVRLHWLNSLGGFDSFNFNLKSIEEDDIKKESYVKQPNVFNGLTYTYQKDARGMVDYDIRKTKKLTINTDYLTDEQSAWMLDLISSPVVYLEQNNELISVTCKERRFKKMTSLNDKLPQYTFDIEYALTNVRQRG